MFNFSFLITNILAVSIYSFSIVSIDGNAISLGQFKGKKMLFVNTATGSQYAQQYAGLEKLYQQYKDSLVIIAFPSNDFGNEGNADNTIQTMVTSKYHPSYILASKLSVKGAGISPLFKWLAESTQNGRIDDPVIGDFCKYLIDGTGNIKGVFAGSVDPMDSVLQNAITDPN